MEFTKADPGRGERQGFGFSGDQSRVARGMIPGPELVERNLFPILIFGQFGKGGEKEGRYVGVILGKGQVRSSPLIPGGDKNGMKAEFLSQDHGPAFHQATARFDPYGKGFLLIEDFLQTTDSGMRKVGEGGWFLIEVNGFFMCMRDVEKGLSDHSQHSHQRIGVDGGGLFLADRVKSHDLGNFLLERQLVRVSLTEENAGSRSTKDSLGRGEVGYGETMLAQAFPFFLVGLIGIDPLSFGVNSGDLEPRASFAGVGTGGRSSVKG